MKLSVLNDVEAQTVCWMTDKLLEEGGWMDE